LPTRHYAIGLIRRHVQTTPNLFEILPIDLQAAHGKKVAREVYANEIDRPFVDQPGYEDWQFEQVARIWWKILEIDFEKPRHQKSSQPAATALIENPRPPPVIVKVFNAPSTETSASSFTYPPEALVQALRHSTGDPTSQFRSAEQFRAFLALGDPNDVIVIAKPGFGKTLLFQAMAELEPSKATIVIVPLTALLDDLSRRLGVATFGTSNFDASQKLIIAHAEQTRLPAFRTLLIQLNHQDKLAAIFFDEVWKRFLLSPSLFVSLSFLPSFLPSFHLSFFFFFLPHQNNITKKSKRSYSGAFVS